MHMRAKILLDFQEVSQILLPESDLIETRLIPLRPSILRPVWTRANISAVHEHPYVIYYIILDVLPVSASYYLLILRANNPSCYAVIDYYDLL